MIELMKDIWGFMRTRRKMWLAPVIFIMLMLGVLIVLAEGSAVAPFIYTLFCAGRRCTNSDFSVRHGVPGGLRPVPS